MAEYVKMAALDAVLNGSEIALPETYVALQDASSGFDGPGSYHIQLVSGGSLLGGLGYKVTYGLPPSDTATAMKVLGVVLTPSLEMVFNDTRRLNIGNTGVNATIAQSPFSDGSYLQSGVVTARTLASGFTVPVAHGTAFPGSPLSYQLFYRDDLKALFVWNGSAWQSSDSLADLNDVSLTSVTEGDILYRGVSEWENLAAGASGDVLTSSGSGAAPSWQAPSGGGFSAAAAIAAMLADTPTILYEFNETSGSTLVDHSGNGNNGTYQSSSTTQLGVYGAFSDKTGAYFDGAHSYATLPIGLSTSAWTIELLVKVMLSETNYPSLIADGHTSSSGNNGITLGFSNNNAIPSGMALLIRNAVNLYQCQNLGAADFQGTPFLFAATFSDSTNLLCLYVNGILIASVATSGAYANNGTTPISIGYNPGYGSSYTGGVYDLFATYGSALTQARLLAHYLAMGPR